MTEAEKFVKERLPRAECIGPVTTYWPGQGNRQGRYLILKSPVHSTSLGSGSNPIEAWANAANRLEAEVNRERE